MNNTQQTKNPVYLLTFGGGEQNYIDAVDRFIKEAKELNFFTEIFPIIDNDLKHDQVFWSRHEAFVTNHKRGYGYWLWKPYLIKKILNTIPETSILVYIDSGCTLNPNGIQRLHEYCEMAYENELVCFQLKDQPEYLWNKQDTIEFIGMAKEDLMSGQLIGTILFLKNSIIVKEIINEWYECCCIKNYHYIDDSPSELPNLNGFKDHRHDQAILSAILKKHAKNYDFVILPDESYFYPNWFYDGRNYPIWATRNRRGKAHTKGKIKAKVTLLFKKISSLLTRRLKHQ